MSLDIAIDPAVATQFPDYRATVIVARGVTNGPSDEASYGLLKAAVATHADLGKATELPHIAAWRAAFSAFGSKPSKYNCSAEALITRALKAGELPRINKLVDLYNAISVQYAIPCGGEDIDRVAGAVRLRLEDDGEVVWADDAGVTCRRWNWRQEPRTRLTEQTTNAYFLLDALPPATEGAVHLATDALVNALGSWYPAASISTLRLG